MTPRAVFLALSSLLALSAPAPAQEIPPLDARLTTYDYPYPVSFRSFQDQGQALEMAYMDVTPQSPNGKTVMLMHGKNFSGAYWKTTAEALLAKGYRVVIPDQIGFGKSSKPTAYQYSFHAYGAQTRALLQELGLQQVSVVGHSMGGMVAARFSLMHPEMVAKLVLVNPIGLEDWKRKVPYATVDQLTAAELQKDASTVREYMSHAYFDGKWNEAYDPLITIQAGWAAGPDKQTLARVSALTSDMVFTQPVLYEFPDLSMPTLLIIGDRDRTAIGKAQASPEVASTLGLYQNLGKQASALIPHGKLVELPGIGHIPQCEDFGAYIGALTDFLEKDA